MDKISVLKSVFYKKIGCYWEHKLFWHNLDCEGQTIFINNELDDVIEDDFITDRYHLSNFLDLHHLWDSFNVAIGNTDLLCPAMGDELAPDFTDEWLTQSSNFNIDVLFCMLSNLNLLSEFKIYMFNQCKQYHKECCDCGYPLIVPNNIRTELLNHIHWKQD